jgi:hypothetical protein
MLLPVQQVAMSMHIGSVDITPQVLNGHDSSRLGMFIWVALAQTARQRM